MILSDVTAADLSEVLELNESSLPHVSSVSLQEIRWFRNHADYFRIVRSNDALAGFLIGLRPGHVYSSPNYRWFVDHYADFGYIDRVAVAKTARRLGVASLLYEDFARTLAGKVDVMTCEVNLRPANESSMHYHERWGFETIATQETDGGSKEVALMEKKL